MNGGPQRHERNVAIALARAATVRARKRSRRNCGDDALGIVPVAVLAALVGALSRMLSREALRLRPGGNVLA